MSESSTSEQRAHWATPEDIAAEFFPLDGSEPDTIFEVRGRVAAAIRAARNPLLADLETAEKEAARAEDQANNLAGDLAVAEKDRDEFKRMFSECHPIHLEGVTRARAAEAELDALREQIQKAVAVLRDNRNYGDSGLWMEVANSLDRDLSAALSVPATPKEDDHA